MFAELEKIFGKQKLVAGAMICQQNDADRNGYILLNGKVELSRRHNNKVIERGVFISSGQVFGVFTSLFNAEARRWTAITVMASEIITIPEKVLAKKIEDMDPFLRYCLFQWYALEHSSKQN